MPLWAISIVADWQKLHDLVFWSGLQVIDAHHPRKRFAAHDCLVVTVRYYGRSARGSKNSM